MHEDSCATASKFVLHISAHSSTKFAESHPSAKTQLGDTVNNLGSKVTLANVEKIRDLNTLCISLARIDFAPNGLNPLHTHPRATEIPIVLEGELYVGFVTSSINNVGNKLFTKTLKKGNGFVFPQGLIHFQLNREHGKAVAIAALSSQNPGTITIANAVIWQTPGP